MASAGGNDWREGNRTIIAIAAEKKPEKRLTHRMLDLQIRLRLFPLFDFKSKRLVDRKDRRRAKVAARAGQGPGGKRILVSASGGRICCGQREE